MEISRVVLERVQLFGPVDSPPLDPRVPVDSRVQQMTFSALKWAGLASPDCSGLGLSSPAWTRESINSSTLEF